MCRLCCGPKPSSNRLQDNGVDVSMHEALWSFSHMYGGFEDDLSAWEFLVSLWYPGTLARK